MVLQIIEENKRPSYKERLGQGVLQGAQTFTDRLMQQDQMRQENEALKKNEGIDLSHIKDPDLRKAYLLTHLQSKARKEAEGMKISGKQDLLKEKLGYVGKLFGGQEGGQGNQAGEINGIEGNTLAEQSSTGYDPSNISDQTIAELTAIDPTLGREARAAKNSAIKQKQHIEDVELKSKLQSRKEIGESYRENAPYINKVDDAYEDSLRKEAILERMNAIQESGDLSSSNAINALETLGLKPEWLRNPANEEYTKLALDLLGGGTLQADYGSRVLASEFKVSQQRIPTLSQTPEGRRQIVENLKTMMLPTQLKKERMQYYLDKSERTGEPLPHNLRGKILQDIKPQLEEAYDKFKQRNGRYKVKEGTIPDDNAIEKYYYLSGENADKAEKLMVEDGYNVGKGRKQTRKAGIHIGK